MYSDHTHFATPPEKQWFLQRGTGMEGLQQQPELQLVEGRIQQCNGYLEKQSKRLKRWKRNYFEVLISESQKM